MVARIFTDIIETEIRVSWMTVTTGYVSGIWFEIEDEDVNFPKSDIDKTDRDLYRALGIAVRRTPEYQASKRESKSNFIKVIKLSGDRYEVRNHLNLNSIYEVVMNSSYTCSCPDHQYRHTECKHIKAVKRESEKTPVAFTSFNGKALTPRLRIVSDVTDAQIREARESLGI